MKKFGHYEVTAELGRGGMGVVYKGWEPSLNRKVAIKCLGEHLLNDKDLVERFTREAKATAALNDPNVIQIYYIGKEGEQPFFAMEYIEGQSLDDILKGGNSLPVKNAKNLLRQACKGLSAAHKLDLVHRDIKPANLMLTTNGTLKIVDFGIARTREYGDKLTNTGEFVGTPGYLSPEVCIGKDVDQRSDIFSLGIVFYEMLAGKVPFENDSPLGLMLEVVQSEIPDIRELNKKVDKKTSYILNKMIAKAPEERYQNCEEIIRDLGSIIENESITNIKSKATVVAKSARPKISEQITLPGSGAITTPNLTPIPKAKGGKKWLVATTLFAVLGAGAFGYYNGYLPIPSSSKSTLSLANTNNKTTDDYADIKTDRVRTENSEIAGKGIMVGINSMFGGDAQKKDEKAVVDNTQINFPTDITEATQEQVAASIDDNLPTIANNTDIPSQIVAESKTKLPPITVATTQKMANTIVKNVQQKSAYKPRPVTLNKGVVVIAFGDPAVANPIEKILETQLRQQGIKVMNEQFITGMRQLMDNGLDLAELKNLIQKNGGQAMVIANINYVGSQQLNYAGRSSELINAQLDIDTYDIKTGDSIGSGFGSKLSYTSLNATDQATDAVMQFTEQLTNSLKNRI